MHGAAVLRQAQRDPLAPALGRRVFGGEQPQLRGGLDADAAAGGHRGETWVTQLRDRLVRVADELGDRPERPQAPAGLMVGHAGGKKFDVARGTPHGTSPSVLPDGFHGNRNGIPSRSPRTTSTP